MKKFFLSRIGLALLLASFLPVLAQEVPASGELFGFKEEDLAGLKLRFDTRVVIVRDDAEPVLKVEIPASEKYPGVAFVSGTGEWDLSAFKGIEAEVSNTGETRLALTLRVDNPGKGDPDTWNAEAAELKPGETKTITVIFGKSWGKEGAAIDPAHIVEAQIFANSPSEDGAILVRSLKAVP